MEKNVFYIGKERFLYRKITVSTLKTNCRGDNSKQQMLSVPSSNIKKDILNPILLTNQNQQTMKKTVFLLFAFMAAITAFGQNLAEGQPSIATSGNAAGGNDGNTGTRWESTSNDPQTWQVDLGSAQEFNRIVIVWEGAYGKTFVIKAGNTVGEDGYLTDASEIVVVEGQELAGFPYTQTFNLNTPVTARYVQFYGTERGTPWGYSFWEFEVYNVGQQTLTTFSLSPADADKADASKSACKVGASIKLTPKALDQDNVDYPLDGIDYSATNGTVDANGYYTPTMAGEGTVTATLDGMTATATIFAYEGDNLLLNKTGVANPEASNVDLFFNGNWGDRGGLGQPADNHTWVYVDLEAYYTINLVDLKQEQAVGKDYTIQFSADGETWNTAYTITDEAGMQGDVRHYFYGASNNTNVRFVKFDCTAPATQWGVSIYEMAAYGVKTGDLEDSVAPVLNTVEVAETSPASVALRLKATDETASTIHYVITNVANSQEYTTTGNSGEEITFEITGLEQGTTYTFSVVAQDSKNSSEPQTVQATTKTMADIPVPTATNVKSIYGAALGNTSGYGFYDWGGGNGSTVTINGKEAYSISNFHWFGSQFDAIDASSMTTLHLDVYPFKSSTLAIVPINANVEGAGNQPEKGYQFDVTGGEWNALEIPVADIIADGVTMSKFYQIKYVSKVANKAAVGATDGFENGDGTLTFYVGNVYLIGEDGGEPEFTLTAAPTPDKAAADVLSVYSDAYTPATTYNIGSWGQSTAVGTQTVNSDDIMMLSNFNYLGFEFNTTLDLSEMEYIHIDVLPMQAMNLGITPILPGPIENSQSVGSLNVKQWNSIDIPLSQFEIDFTSAEAFQLKLDKGTGSEVVYVDNIFFWKSGSAGPVDPTEGTVLTSGDHSVTLYPYHYTGTNNYELIITSEETMTGLGGSFWHINGNEAADIRTNMTISADGKTITINATSTEDPQLYTPLYVMMPGEVNFGMVTLEWIEKGGSTAEITAIAVVADENEVQVGKTLQLSVKDQDDNVVAASQVTFVSSDDAIATVDENGVVTGVAEGDVMITATLKDNTEISSTLAIVVTAAASDALTAGEADENGLVKLTGTWSDDEFAAIDAVKQANSYDLTEVVHEGTLDVIGKTANPYCLFVTAVPGTVNRNEVVKDGDAYNGFAFFLQEEPNANKPFDINTAIAPITVTNPFFQRLFDRAGYYVTMTVPFSYTQIPDGTNGTKFYELNASSNSDGVTLTFTEVASIEANKPYLVYSGTGGITIPDAGVVSIDWNAQEESSDVASFIGNYKALQPAESENIYVVPGGVTEQSDVAFVKSAGASIRPFRAYLTLPSATKINVVFGDGEATGINGVSDEMLNALFNIYSIDGKLVKSAGEKMFNMKEGIYIINGKRVIIR